MKEVFAFLELFASAKLMTRCSFFPGGTISVSVYNVGPKEDNYFYTESTPEILVMKLKRDFAQFTFAAPPKPPVHMSKLPPLPLPSFKK